MENNTVKTGKFFQSITVKAFIVGFLALILLIPQLMLEGLIEERSSRSEETIEKISQKWSRAQTICGPILVIPFSTSEVQGGQIKTTHRELSITPDILAIKVALEPEERHYGIYKAILYKSEAYISGEFGGVDLKGMEAAVFDFKNSYLKFGLSDLKGVVSNITFTVAGKHYEVAIAGEKDNILGKVLAVMLDEASLPEVDSKLAFSSKVYLNGSNSISFIPIGKTTTVEVQGDWASPGFIGNFSPDYTLEGNNFDAKWSILRFNRNIPDTWVDSDVSSFNDTSFGVTLVDTVNHYQQNMRSVKYALMFIGLTFVVFFFIEILSYKKIHPVQYLLVGIALILFYSLLLSLSELMSFALAYLMASAATIGLITVYANSIVKSKVQAGLLLAVLTGLYTFLYVILQLEDRALMIGSIGMFLALAIIMYVSRKVSWYKDDMDANLS